MSAKTTLTCKMPLPSSQFPSLLMLTHSKCTSAVSLTTGLAALNSTTVSSLSAMDLKTVKTTGWLKTPGAPPGVNPATSDSPEDPTVPVCAVSPCKPLTLLPNRLRVVDG